MRFKVSGGGSRLPALALLVFVTACTTGRSLEPFQPQQFGAVITPAARIRAGDAVLLSSCERDAEAARAVVTSWFEVVSRIDECDLASARYYAGTDKEAEITDRLEWLARSGSPACGAEAAQVIGRIRAANRQVRRWIPGAVGLCSLAVQRADLDSLSRRMTDRTGDIRCRIQQSFPELAGGRC